MRAAVPIAGVDLRGEPGPIQPDRKVGQNGVRDVDSEWSDAHGYIDRCRRRDCSYPSASGQGSGLARWVLLIAGAHDLKDSIFAVLLG